MPQLVVTDLIRKTARAALDQCSDLTEEEQSAFQALTAEAESEEGVALDTLRSLLRRSQQLSDENNPRTLLALLRGSKPYHYIPPPPPRNPELEKRVQRLRSELENRQYRKMVRGIIEPASIRRIKDSMELKDATSQISVGVNIIATMFTCFVLGWFLGWKAFGDQVLAICTGVIFLIIGMMVDMWLFVINASTLDKHLERRRKREQQSKLLPNYQGLIKYD